MKCLHVFVLVHNCMCVFVSFPRLIAIFVTDSADALRAITDGCVSA